MAPFEIRGNVASDGKRTVFLGEPGRLFRRRAARSNGETAEWCVAELLDGLRIYIDGDNVVITRQDLNP